MDAGLRVDRAVMLHLEGISRSRLQQCIATGLLRVNGLLVKPSTILKQGDKVVVQLVAKEPLHLVPQALPLTILYQDDQLLVLNKPAGMVVHPGAGIAEGTIANALVHYFGSLPGTDQLRPGIVHRLDKDTSGLLLVTLTEESQNRVSAMFRERQLVKEYTALVHGGMETPRGSINKPIGRHPVHRLKMTTNAPHSRPCLTDWVVEREYSGFTLLRVILHTGRTHQIRVHLSSIGHPVVGDTLYGGNRHLQIRNTRLRDAISGLGRFFLHASRLKLTHPFTGKPLDFSAPLPPELEQLLAVVTASPR